MDKYIENLRRINLTIMSLCFIGFAFILIPSESAIVNAAKQYEILLKIHNQLEKFPEAFFDQEQLIEADKFSNLFEEKYFDKIYNVKDSNLLVYWERKECIKKDKPGYGTVRGKCYFNIWDRVPNYVNNLDEFIEIYNKLFSVDYIEIPVNLNLEKGTIKEGLTKLKETSLEPVEKNIVKQSEGYSYFIRNIDKSDLLPNYFINSTDWKATNRGTIITDSKLESITSPKPGTSDVVLYAMKGWKPPVVSVQVSTAKRFYKQESFMIKSIGLFKSGEKPLVGFTFEERYPELNSMLGEVKSISMKDTEALLKSQKKLYSKDIKVFGATFNSSILGTVLIYLIGFCSLFFYMHWNEFVIVFKGLNKPKIDNILPWIGIYNGILPRLMFLLSIVFVPVIITFILFLSSIDSSFFFINALGMFIVFILSLVNLTSIRRFNRDKIIE